MTQWTRSLAALTGALLLITAGLAPLVSRAQEATPLATASGSPTADASAGATPVASWRLTLIGEQIIPNVAEVDGALVAGISGIDYDPLTTTWLLISDDKSEAAPARFSTATLTYDGMSFDAVTVDTVVSLLDAERAPFPAPDTSPGIVDPESIRFDPVTGGVVWASEGDRPTEQTPFIALAGLDGSLTSQLPLPDAFALHADTETGSRHNLTREGLTLSPDGESIWVGMESASYDDGPLASVEAGTRTWLMQFDRDDQLLAAYAYPLDALPLAPAGDELFGVNGLTEILAISDTQLLVIERAASRRRTALSRTSSRSIWPISAARPTSRMPPA